MNVIKRLFKKKERKEPERNPYFMNDYCILKKDIAHQGIGGKKAYFDRKVTACEIVELATNGNIGCRNFIERRPDLFKGYVFTAVGRPSWIITPEGNKKRYHYVKIWNNPEHLQGDYTYLGYIICSDEIAKAYKVSNKEEK